MGGGDNIGDCHLRWHHVRRQAMESGEPITVYANRRSPTESVADRGIRWDQLGFLLILPLVFGGAGLGAIAFFLRGYREGTWRAAWAEPKFAIAAVSGVTFRQVTRVVALNGAAGNGKREGRRQWEAEVCLTSAKTPGATADAPAARIEDTYCVALARRLQAHLTLESRPPLQAHLSLDKALAAAHMSRSKVASWVVSSWP